MPLIINSKVWYLNLMCTVFVLWPFPFLVIYLRVIRKKNLIYVNVFIEIYTYPILHIENQNFNFIRKEFYKQKEEKERRKINGWETVLLCSACNRIETESCWYAPVIRGVWCGHSHRQKHLPINILAGQNWI